MAVKLYRPVLMLGHVYVRAKSHGYYTCALCGGYNYHPTDTVAHVSCSAMQERNLDANLYRRMRP